MFHCWWLFESIFNSFVVGLLRVPSGKSKKKPYRELCFTDWRDELWICVAWQTLKDLLVSAQSNQIKLAHLPLAKPRSLEQSRLTSCVCSPTSKNMREKWIDDFRKINIFGGHPKVENNPWCIHGTIANIYRPTKKGLKKTVHARKYAMFVPYSSLVDRGSKSH